MRKSILISLLVLFCMTSCNTMVSDLEIDVNDRVPLEIKGAYVLAVDTKAPITGNRLYSANDIGITLLNSDETIFNNYNNVICNGIGDMNSTKIYLGSNDVTVYSYHPYNAEVTDITAIPVDIATQKDYMYGIPVSGINKLNPSTTITMKHALQLVIFDLTSIKNKFVSWDTISFSGVGFATGAKLNAKTGELYDFTGIGDEILISEEDFDSMFASGFLVIPTGESGELRITIKIGNEEYTATTTLDKTQQGSSLKFGFTVVQTLLEVNDPISVESWPTSTDKTLNIY